MPDTSALPNPDDFLTPQEQRLVDCAARGVWWEPEHFPKIGPPTAAQDTARTIRAAIIRCLLLGDGWLGREQPWPIGAKGLMARGARIDGIVDLDGAKLHGTVWLHDCTFTGNILLTDAECHTISLRGAYAPIGLDAARATIKGVLDLSMLVAKGRINLQAAKIDGMFNCVGSQIENDSGRALDCNGVVVGSSVILRQGFTAKGGVNLVGAKIAGQLSCDDGYFENADGPALDAAAVSVGADVFLRKGFSAKGEVGFVRAKIDGQLSCANGRFENKNGRAFNGDAMTVGADVFLSDGFFTDGQVNFHRATIGGNLHCRKAAFENEGDTAVDLTLAKIGAGLYFAQLKPKKAGKRGLEGWLVLDHATCKTFSDDKASWPEKGKLVLDGFAYERFQNCSTDAEARREWLELQPEEHLKTTFRPQPWTQAIKVLRDMGHDEAARDLAIAREITRTKSDGTNGLQKLWLRLQRRTTGFGYRPRYAFFWSLLFFALGWLTFATAANLGYMAPRDGNVVTYLAAHPGAKLPEHFTRFNAAVFALDNYLPIIELGQDQAWEPSDVQTGHERVIPGETAWERTVRLVLGHSWTITGARPMVAGQIEAGMPMPHSGFLAWVAGWVAWAFSLGFHRLIYWTLEFLGWIFVSLYIAGMSGVMKDD